MSQRTLDELREAIFAACGWINPFSNPPTKTLAALRGEIKDQLGLADPITSVATRSLANLQSDLMHALGYGASAASPPPGMAGLMVVWINNAQDLLFRRLELDKGGESLPTRMTASGDMTTLDFVPVLELATAMGKAHYGRQDAKAHFDAVERWLADEANRNPPNIDESINTLLIEAQQTVYRRYEMARGESFSLNAFAADGDSTTVDYLPVYLLALANLCAKLKREDAKAYREQYERYMADLERRMPANAYAHVTQQLRSAQRVLIKRYPVLDTERFFTWTLVAGQNLYELNENDEQTEAPICTDVLDPRRITWAGIERDGVWCSLICGIPPECYSHNDWSGWPSRYEVRQCIELWPAPGTEEQKLRLKGHFLLLPFSADDDQATIDDEAVYLLALANTKTYFKQPDAQNYLGELEAYIRNLTAGLHQTRRYVPGQSTRSPAYVTPVPTDPF